MKGIAHSYVAEKVTGKKHPNLYIGCLLPDITPYTTATDVFDEVDLHGEAAIKFYRHLQNTAPKDLFLAIGILSHGKLYGADRYNDIEYRGGPGYAHQKKEPLIDEVQECSKVLFETAIIRAHNFIELGLDYLLLQRDQKLVERITAALSQADLEKIARYFSECFNKNKNKILSGLSQLTSCYKTGDLNSVEGVAAIWAKQAAGLPEHDRVDIKKAAAIIKKAADLIKDDYMEFLNFTVSEVRKNLKPFLDEAG